MFKNSSSWSIQQLRLLASNKICKYCKNTRNARYGGVGSQRFKATAVNLAENLEDSKAKQTKIHSTFKSFISNHNDILTIENRLKYGHTGKSVQEKIASEANLGKKQASNEGIELVKAKAVLMPTFSAALKIFFEALERFKTKNEKVRCNQAVMIASDGVALSYKEIFDIYNWLNFPYKPVRVFTYNFIGKEKDMACKVLNYIPVMGMPLDSGQHDLSVIWTHVFEDLERNNRLPPLMNLVFANRKLSFYDTSNHAPSSDEVKRHREQEQRNAEDVLFDMFYNEETGLISMGKFLAALKTTGIRRSDPRLKELMENLKKVHKLANYETGSSAETQNLNRDTFKAVVAQNIVLIAKAFRQQFVIPDFVGFVKDIEDIYWKCKSNTDGKMADYIPQLARYSPDLWGVSICTIDGQRYSIGDVESPFTLQSCSKPLTYALALEKLGADEVHSYVGQEPSGRNFNELILDYNKKPHNPMINAGAILTCSLIQTMIEPDISVAEKFDYVLSWFRRLSGGENISFNNAVFLSEREAADRNYALGFYMRENKCFPKRTVLKDVMDFYFQCCSMETTCEAMSVIAATLANGGICPTTEEKVFRPEVVRDVLSIMHSCGTYDYSGQFAFKVGLPAKSGVSGGMMLVIPNVMGIFAWSPPLDKLGNSVRALQFCEELVNVFNFHRYDNLKHASNKKDPRKHRYETKGLSIVNLLFSAASGDVTALRRHRLSGMDITLADYDGRTALHLAASEGHLECVKFLLEQCHVPHNPKDRWGNLPIDEAQNFGHHAVVDFLKEWSEKNQGTEDCTSTGALITNTEANEEICHEEIKTECDRSSTASPMPSESSSSSGPDDNSRPGL